MNIYADTSFFVSVYLADSHSGSAQSLMTSKPFLFMTSFHVAEWTRAVEQHVFHGFISRSEADLYHDRFRRHSLDGTWAVSALPETVFDLCADLARRHGATLGLRTLDSLHVASALALKAERFWTFDARQKKLARAVGLKTN